MPECVLCDYAGHNYLKKRRCVSCHKKVYWLHKTQFIIKINKVKFLCSGNCENCEFGDELKKGTLASGNLIIHNFPQYVSSRRE